MDNVRERIIIRNQNQFEIKYTYPLQLERKHTEYMVEMFFFMPQNLYINRSTYSKDDFYRDTVNYIRFKTPAFLLPDMIHGENCPLERTRHAIAKLAAAPADAAARENYSYHLKMFCSILKSALRDEEEYIENINSIIDRYSEAKVMLNTLAALLEEFRKLRSGLPVNDLESSLKALFSFSDEYISILAERYLFKLLRYGNSLNDEPQYPEIRQEIIAMIRAEEEYRMTMGYPSIVRENSTNETFIYRMRTLKKIMGSILFLRTRNSHDGKLAEQIVVTLTAGLAMSMALVVILLGQRLLNDLSMSVAIVAVVAYMFREKTKELGKVYFVGWIRQFFYDYRTTLLDNMNRKIGSCREVMAFLTPKNVPRSILKARNQDLIAALVDSGFSEEIVYSKKYIKINNELCKTIWSDFQVDGINDIVRINLSEIMTRMGNPDRPLYMPTDTGYKEVPGISVYHMNLVLRYGMGEHSEIRKFRLILNRNGIQRIVETAVD